MRVNGNIKAEEPNNFIGLILIGERTIFAQSELRGGWEYCVTRKIR
jgi:hypothetical protein